MSAFIIRGKKQPKKEPPTCLLLNRDSMLLARGEMKSAPDDPHIEIELISGEGEKIESADIVQVVPSDKTARPRMGRYVMHRDDRVVLKPMRAFGAALRENFRVPVFFESFIYPREGGRAVFHSLDLSCGGIALYCNRSFDVGEVFEVVIPITAEGPLLLDCEVLRAAPFEGNAAWKYAAKFVDLINDQEAALREAVFQLQVQTAQTAKKA